MSMEKYAGMGALNAPKGALEVKPENAIDALVNEASHIANLEDMVRVMHARYIGHSVDQLTPNKQDSNNPSCPAVFDTLAAAADEIRFSVNRMEAMIRDMMNAAG